MSALLEVRQLRASYGAGEVLSDLNLEIAPGEFATLLGRNGMGKTTTVRAILGLTRPLGGEIRFGGERIDGWTPDRVARAIRRLDRGSRSGVLAVLRADGLWIRRLAGPT